jgi:hypothetical protein
MGLNFSQPNGLQQKLTLWWSESFWMSTMTLFLAVYQPKYAKDPEYWQGT